MRMLCHGCFKSMDESPAPVLPPSLDKYLTICETTDEDDLSSSSDSEPTIFQDNSDEDPEYRPTDSDPPSSVDINLSLNNTGGELLRPRHTLATGSRSRKRKANSSEWKKIVKQRLREQNKSYKNESGKYFLARKIKKPCEQTCPYKCTVHITENKRKAIHDRFWTMSDIEKRNFYSKFVSKTDAKRKRTMSENSRRTNSFKYFFEIEGARIQVCKTFFLATLDISQRRIYYFFKKNYNFETGSPLPSSKGKHVKKKTPDHKIKEVKEHIEKFPCIDPHYLRAGSQRQYLEPGLNIKRMYKMYKDQTADPVKYHIYRNIFNTEYNLSFFVPKKDQCDLCVQFDGKTLNLKEQERYENHIKWNENAKKRRDEDKSLNDPNTAVILYDLQNVFQLPHSNVSNFFYKRKFNTYNLTGLCILNKTTYCCLWYETQSGRTGNDIASALNKILCKVVEDLPYVSSIVLWSDSCIPQNRNRVTSMAILKFLESHPKIKRITQRFSEAGHSRIQNLDAVHSVIERHLRHISYYSPVSLLRILKSMNYDNVTLKILQCNSNDFFNYNTASLGLNFIPYSTAREIEYNSDNLLQIRYRKDYGDNSELFSVPIVTSTTNRKKVITENQLPTVSNSVRSSNIPQAKIKDIKSMIKFMPAEDANFYNAVLKL